MNSEQTTTRVMRESKNKIRVDFERTSRWTRFRIKYLSLNFLGMTIFRIFRFLLLLGISYVILYPFFAQIAASVMVYEDFTDVTVLLISKSPTLEQYKAIITENHYFEALFNTATLSLACAVMQTFVCAFVGYGFAKYKFRGNKIFFLIVIFTMVVPHSVLRLSMFLKFSKLTIPILDKLPTIPGIGGIFSEIPLIGGQLNLLNTNWPLILLSLTGLGFKNGLYIFIMRQFFKGVPDELEESAYIDGSGVFRTFFTIILPLSIPMMVTIFLFAFSWQWTDNFYTKVFYTSSNKTMLLPNIVGMPPSLQPDSNAGLNLYSSAINNTCGLMIIAPLIVLYLFCQKSLVQGIERSGIIG